MEIKKIKEIQNIGAFADFKGGGCLEFEKLTFIYGYNTFGKTTLTDIFQSLKNNDPKIINSRETIPKINIDQKVQLSIKETTESSLTFKNNQWGQNNLSQNLEIFGTDFISKNLFTGFAIERENKVNFTKFILGKSGVDLAEKITNNKKELRNKKKELKKNKIPVFVKNKFKEEIKKFIEFNIDNLDKEKINNDLIKKKKEKQDEKNRLKEPQKILTLPDIWYYDFSEIQILDYFQNLNNLFQKDYSNIKSEILKKINSHIENNFKKNDNAEDWIKQGLNNCKDKKNGNCIFCGQSLQNAKNLINAYDSYFDDEYNKFIAEIEQNLSLNIREIKNINFWEENKLQKILTIVFKFKELIKNKDFQDNLKKLEEEVSNLQEGKLNKIKNIFLEIFEKSCALKNKKPYKKVAENNFQKFTENFKKYEKTLKEIKKILETLKKHIDNFKNQYKNTTKIQGQIINLEKEINDLEYQKARIEQDQDCKNCITDKKEIDILIETIQKQEEQLQKNQSKYLNNYFDKINELFDKFGSHNFLLEKETSHNGDMPVYSLKIKFHGKEILKTENNDLKTIFSDSDRRALALAIFWTKIETKSKEEKEKTIVILDDPITSFDKERSKSFISYFKEYHNKLSQILIFTHYDFFIKQYAEYTNSKLKGSGVKVYQLEKENNEGKITSIIKKFDVDTFLKSDYLKYYDSIYKFINYEKSNFDETHLRIFFENCYLPIFEKKISKEKRKKYMSELSPANHKTKFENDEAIRLYAENMMVDLYSFEFLTKY